MTLTLVSHSPCPPALFGALAATVAQAQDGVLMHLPADFLPEHGADSAQMVAAQGALVPSGLIWYERLTGREILPASTTLEIVEAARLAAVVVPWHADVQAPALYQALIEQASAAGVQVRHLQAREQGKQWHLEEQNGLASGYGYWRRDVYGRWVNTALTTQQRSARHPLVIALLGTEADQLDVYPATLAALGDAADAADIDLQIRFVSPKALDLTLLDSVAGIVLPGGSDMANVAGQIAVARHALTLNIAIVGLCLGMQSMTTALAQTLPRLALANMAEAAPHAAIYSFLPMADTAGLPEHRLGKQTLSVKPSPLGDRLSQCLDIRCNHRFMLNPEITQDLLDAGLNISATDASGLIADAIDWPHHAFYRGMQGHPELSSSSANPHPLIEDFLFAAQASATRARRHPEASGELNDIHQ